MLLRKSFFLILIIVFLSLSFLFINIKVLPVYATTTYFSETFETFLNGWSNGNDTNGEIGKTSEVFHDGSYSWFYNTTTISQTGYTLKALTIIPKSNYHISFWLYTPSKNSYSDVLCQLYNSSTGTSNFKTDLNCINGTISLCNVVISGAPDTLEVVGTLTNNTWHYIEIFYNISSHKIHYYIDSIKQGSDWNYLNNVYPTTYYIGDVSGTSMYGKFFIDTLNVDDISESIYSLPVYDISKTNTNSTNSISNWLFYSYWYTSGANLSGYIFSFNASGSLVNDTWTNFPDTNSTWANITKTISNNVGNIISWQVFANNSYGWTTLPLQNVTVTATITFYFNSNGILEKNGTSVTNSSSTTYNSLSPVIHLSGVPISGTAFMNFTISGTLITNNPYNFTVQNSTSIWCSFENTSILSYSLGYSIGYSIGYTEGLGNGTGTPYLVARFSLNNSAPYQNETLFYNATLSSSSSNITSFNWNFGDGNSATGNTTTHKYALDGIFLINLTVSSGSMIDTMLQNITVSATTLTITGLDGTFALLMVLLTVCLVLCVFRVPLIGFVFSLFTVSFSAWALTDTLLPLYPMINVFIAVIGGICFYLNIQKFRESNTTKKNTSKLARRF